MRCPYCGSVVDPLRDARGDLVCPACSNTGQVAAGWTQPAALANPAAPLPGQAGPVDSSAAVARPTSGKAIAALVLGICSIMLWPTAIVTAPLALIFGVQALKQTSGPAPRAGRGMAIAGIVCGSVGIVIAVVVGLAFLVFAIVSSADGGPDLFEDQWAFDVDDAGPGGVLTVTGYPGFPAWSEFTLGGDADCRLPSGDVDYGDDILCTADGTVLLLDADTGETLYSADV